MVNLFLCQTDNIDSNYIESKETLVDQVPLPKENIHRVGGELIPQNAALEYSKSLRYLSTKSVRYPLTSNIPDSPYIPEAHLQDVNLFNVDITGAGLRPEKLVQVRLLPKAKMPDGSK